MSKIGGKSNSKKRLAILFLMISLLLIVCLGRQVKLIVDHGSEYYHKALSQATGNGTAILSQPGDILDANGTKLAESVKVYRLILDPKVLKEKEEDYPGSTDITCKIISEAFGLNEDEVRRAYRENPDLSYIRFGGNTILTEDQKEHFDALNESFTNYKKDQAKEGNPIKAQIAGVWFEEEYRRDYPLYDVLSKVIGYTTADGKTGITGLEYQYDDILRGTDGVSYKYVDTDGKITSEVIEAQDGYTLQTSLDANAAAMIREAIDWFQEEIGGKRVNVLLMNPNTAEVIAMVSDTEYDLNKPQDISYLFTDEEWEKPKETFLLQEAFKGEKNQAYLEAMSDDDAHEALKQQVQNNYQVSGAYEPGSTAKGLTLASAYEEGVINDTDTFYDPGSVQIGKYTIHCHQEVPCGTITAMEAYGRSCNTAFVAIGERLGPEAFSRYQELFNLGQRTGIDLPGEANTAPLIYYENTLGDIELATCAFGQGFNVTMIQLASAYASIVNGGYYYEPHVVTKIIDSEGNTVKDIQPTVVRRTISEKTSAYMREAMYYVTTYGTATPSVTEGYTVAGKTGAAEKIPRGTGKYVVSFMAAVPAAQPKLLLYVTVDEPDVEDQSQSLPAQLLAKACLEKLYSYYGIYPEAGDDAYSYDWSTLGNETDLSDGANGESNIEGEAPEGITPEGEGIVDPAVDPGIPVETAAPVDPAVDPGIPVETAAPVDPVVDPGIPVETAAPVDPVVDPGVPVETAPPVDPVPAP